MAGRDKCTKKSAVPFGPAVGRRYLPGSPPLLASIHLYRPAFPSSRVVYGTMTRRRERAMEKVAGRWPMSSPSASRAVADGLAKVNDSA
jgi:hypothetical protein